VVNILVVAYTPYSGRGTESWALKKAQIARRSGSRPDRNSRSILWPFFWPVDNGIEWL
jgi:hypothetical protein